MFNFAQSVCCEWHKIEIDQYCLLQDSFNGMLDMEGICKNGGSVVADSVSEVMFFIYLFHRNKKSRDIPLM